MLQVFITINSELQNKIAEAYMNIFNGPPYYESWTKQESLDELLRSSRKEGFICVFAEKEEDIIGFSWGYKLPENNLERIAFEKIRNKLEENKINPNKTFYGAESGVRIDLRKKGIGTLMLRKRFAACKDFNTVIFRTKNPTMINIYRKVAGKKEKLSFLEESSYEGGRVYVFNT